MVFLLLSLPILFNIQNDEDEMEMMALREQALKSLISNRSSTAVATNSSSTESAPRIQNNNPPYPVHDQRPMPIQPQPQHNTMTPHLYNNNSSSYRPRPFGNSQYSGYHHPSGFQPINPMIPVQPHASFHPIPYNPALPLPMNGGAAPLDTHKYEPTPAARLSPRSAQ